MMINKIILSVDFNKNIQSIYAKKIGEHVCKTLSSCILSFSEAKSVIVVLLVKSIYSFHQRSLLGL